MSSSGALFDMDKVLDISKNVISRMTAEEVFDDVEKWAEEYDPEFASELKAAPDYAKEILARRTIAISATLPLKFSGFFLYSFILNLLCFGCKYTIKSWNYQIWRHIFT